MGFNHNIKSPCMVCKERYMGCHGSCESYLTYQTKCKQVNQSRIKSLEATRDFISARGLCKK